MQLTYFVFIIDGPMGKIVVKHKAFIEDSCSLVSWAPLPYKSWNIALTATKSGIRPYCKITEVPPERDYFAFLIPPPIIFTRRRDHASDNQGKSERLHNLFFVWSCIRHFWLECLQATSDSYSKAFPEKLRLTRTGWNDLLSGVYFRKLWPVPPGQKLSGEFEITHFWKYGWGELFQDLPEHMRSQPVPTFGNRLLQPADFESDELKALVTFDVVINSMHHEFLEADRVLMKDRLEFVGEALKTRSDAKALLFRKTFSVGSSFTPDHSASSTRCASWMLNFITAVKDWPQSEGVQPPVLHTANVDIQSITNSFEHYIPIYYQGIMDALRIPPTMLLQTPIVSQELLSKVAMF